MSRYLNVGQTCKVAGCVKPAACRGMCHKHDQRVRKGIPVGAVLYHELPARDRLMLRLVDRPTGCKEWPGDSNNKGYGTMILHGKRRLVHRVAYEAFVGPIPSGMVVMHTCDNPRCANPAHLMLGTQLDNMRDCIAKGRHSVPPRRPPAKCGTVSGHSKHQREGSRPCDACAEAKRAYMLAWRTARRAS